MDNFCLENRDYFSKRIQELESTSNGYEVLESPADIDHAPDVSIRVRIRPFTEYEKECNHFVGVSMQQSGAVNIYEPRRKINGKPEVNVSWTF